MVDNLRIWERVEQPPDWALKAIQAGRLKGKTDINPQWRLHVMTEVFGPCGDGWWFTVDKQWLEPGPEGAVSAFVNITLYTEDCDKGVPGTGGSSFIASERSGLHMSNEAYKMALTDALSVAMKFLGVAAQIYYGAPVTKYSPNPSSDPPEQKESSTKSGTKSGTKKQAEKETDEAADLLHAEVAFNDAWAAVMEAIGEDDADNIKALRRKFFKATTEKSDAFLAMTDSTAGMTAKEIKLATAMVTKGKDKLAGLCLGEWREELGLASLGVETCSACAAILNEKEKAAWVTVGLDKPYCEKHAGVALTEKMKGGAGEA